MVVFKLNYYLRKITDWDVLNLTFASSLTKKNKQTSQVNFIKITNYG